MKLSWIPGRGLLRLLLAWVGLSILAAALPAWHGPWIVVGLAILVVTGIAVAELTTSPGLTISRHLPASLPLGEWTDVTLRLVSTYRRAVHCELFDHHPSSAESRKMPATLTLPSNGTQALTYQLRPRRRGDVRFQHVEIWRRSFGDLLRRRYLLGDVAQVRVLPNFRPILAQGLAGAEAHVAQLGMHLQRRRGEGLEFQELRDYRDGDSLRQVDWKATARRGKLIARQYQDERNQQVVLLLDCGRRMHAREGDLTHFDHVLNAVLLLTYVAIRQGDAVGLQTFAGDDRWLPARAGTDTLLRMLDTIHDLQTSTESADYATAAARLMARQRRRALVLLLTNLRDEDTDEVLRTIHALRQRHLVLVASTRELALGALRAGDVSSHRAALDVSATHHYLAARSQAHAAVRAAGALVLDVEPPLLPSALAARYLDIKRAGQL